MMGAAQDLLARAVPNRAATSLNTMTDSDEYLVLRCDQLVAWPGNREVGEAAVAELADSMASDGQLQPILVRPLGDRYQVLAGHHRWAAKELLQRREPGNPAHRTIKAVCRDLNDAEADAAVWASNLCMVPLYTSEERGAMYMELAKKVPAMRRADPELYRGVPTAQIVAELVNANGGRTSKTTVNRDLAAARKAESHPEGAMVWDGREVPKRAADALERLDAGRVGRIRAEWEARGRDDGWLVREARMSDPVCRQRDASAACRSAVKSLGVLADAVSRGAELDDAERKAIVQLAEEAASGGEGDAS